MSYLKNLQCLDCRKEYCIAVDMMVCTDGSSCLSFTIEFRRKGSW